MITIQKPVRRTVEFTFRHNNVVDFKRFNLPFPYVVFKTGHSSYLGKHFLSVGFCNEYPNNETDVYFPALPNLYCSIQDVLFNYACLKTEFNEDFLISDFWQSQFNFYNHNWFGDRLVIEKFYHKDIGEPLADYHDYYNMIFESLANWEKLDLSYIWRAENVMPLTMFDSFQINTRPIEYRGVEPPKQKITFQEFCLRIKEFV